MEEISKVCNVCSQSKTLEHFSNKKRGLFGKASRCKTCDAAYHKQHRAANYEVRRVKEKAYKEANREKIKASSKKYDQRNKEKIAERKKLFRQENKERLAAQKKEYRSKPEVKARDRAYVKNKRKTDVNFKLKALLRLRNYNFIKASKGVKAGSAVKDLGCSIEEFKLYIESKWEPWMTWSNHGVFNAQVRTWHLDHIIPLCKFDLSNRDQFLKACHYTNIQPLGAAENYKKNRF